MTDSAPHSPNADVNGVDVSVNVTVNDATPVIGGGEDTTTNVNVGVQAPCTRTSHLPSPSGTKHLVTPIKNTNITHGNLPDIQAVGRRTLPTPSNFNPIKTRTRKCIHVLVRSQMGCEHVVRMRETDTVERIKARIYSCFDIPGVQQQLIFKDVELKEHTKTAKELGLGDGSIINLVPRIHAGPMGIQIESAIENEVVLIDSVASQLSDAQKADLLMSGHSVSLVAKIGGKYVIVKLRSQRKLTTGDGQSLLLDSAVSVSEDDNNSTQSLCVDEDMGVARDTENNNMKKKMEEVRTKMAARKNRISGTTSVSKGRSTSTIDAASSNFAVHRFRRRSSMGLLPTNGPQ